MGTAFSALAGFWPGWPMLRGGLIAAAVALAMALIGRLARAPLVASIAPGAGQLAGWYALFGAFYSIPRLLPNRLPIIGLGITLLVLVALLLRTRRLGAVLLAAFVGYWLVGAPLKGADWRLAAPDMLGISALLLLLIWLASPARWAMSAGAATLTGGLAIVGSESVWLVAALVPLGAALGGLASPPSAGTALAEAGGIAAVAAAAVLAQGRLPSGNFGAMDTAALAPLIAAWLAGRLHVSLAAAGPAAEVLAASGAVAITLALVAGGSRFFG